MRTCSHVNPDRRIEIVSVNNLRYAIELYLERRHPEFCYDTSLHRFMDDFITAALKHDLGLEYTAVSKWASTMLIYDDAKYDIVQESLSHVLETMLQHLRHATDEFSDAVAWEWLNSRELDIVIYGRGG